MNLMHIWIVLTVLLTQQVTSLQKYSSFQEIDNELNIPRESQRQTRFRIGIFTQDCPTELRNGLEETYKLAEKNGADALNYYNSCTYVRVSYVEWLKTRNVEVVIIDIYQSDEDIAEILETLNGIVLTGGYDSIYTYQDSLTIQIDAENSMAVKTLTPTYYALKAAAIVDKAKKINTRRVFGVWGTCLGMQSILTKESNFSLRLDVVDNLNTSSTIHLIDNTSFSSFLDQYQNAKAKLESDNLSYFNHTYGILSSTFQNTDSLRSKYDLLAVSQNPRGEQFVEMVKSKEYPFFAIQSHPEFIKFRIEEEFQVRHPSDVIELSEHILDYFLKQLGDWEYDHHNQHDEYFEMANLFNQNSVIKSDPIGDFKCLFVFNGRNFHF